MLRAVTEEEEEEEVELGLDADLLLNMSTSSLSSGLPSGLAATNSRHLAARASLAFWWRKAQIKFDHSNSTSTLALHYRDYDERQRDERQPEKNHEACFWFPDILDDSEAELAAFYDTNSRQCFSCSEVRRESGLVGRPVPRLLDSIPLATRLESLLRFGA